MPIAGFEDDDEAENGEVFFFLLLKSFPRKEFFRSKLLLLTLHLGDVLELSCSLASSFASRSSSSSLNIAASLLDNLRWEEYLETWAIAQHPYMYQG